MELTQDIVNNKILTNTRKPFMLKVYAFVNLAILFFMAVQTVLYSSGISESFYNIIAGSSMAWLAVLAAYMLLSVIAAKAVVSMRKSVQLSGLLFYATIEALIFSPFIYYAFESSGPGVIIKAALVSILGFIVLSAIGINTKKDLSVLQGIITVVSIGALMLIVGSLVIGFSLGMWFSVAMVMLASAMILKESQQIHKTFHSDQYIAAALQLFSSIMLLFWYVLRIFLSRD